MSWTDERIQELKDLWQQGHSASEIGKRMEVSKNAVVGKAHRLNLPSRPSPIKQQETGASDDAASGSAAEQPARKQRKTDSRKSASRGDGSGKNAGGNGAAVAGRGVVGTYPASIRAQVEALGGRSGCVWPIGDPNDPEFRFCGAPTAPGKPYCSEHAARAYITRSRNDRDERDEEAA